VTQQFILMLLLFLMLQLPVWLGHSCPRPLTKLLPLLLVLVLQV